MKNKKTECLKSYLERVDRLDIWDALNEEGNQELNKKYKDRMAEYASVINYFNYLIYLGVTLLGLVVFLWLFLDFYNQ